MKRLPSMSGVTRQKRCSLKRHLMRLRFVVFSGIFVGVLTRHEEQTETWIESASNLADNCINLPYPIPVIQFFNNLYTSLSNCGRLLYKSLIDKLEMNILSDFLTLPPLVALGTDALRLLLSFALSVFIVNIYLWTHTKVPQKSFTDTLIILCMLISVVMVIIGDSIARAFSLVGALVYHPVSDCYPRPT